MGILNEIASKARDLIDVEGLLNRRTKVYDASKNKINVAGVQLDGVTSATLGAETITKAEQGTSKFYYAFYELDEIRTLTVNLLPTAKCIDVLEGLAFAQNKKKGYFTITVIENGVPVDVYKAHIISTPSRTMQLEADERTFVFGLCESQNNTFIQTTTIEQE